MKGNAKALLVVSKDVDQEIHAEKTNYVSIPCEQNAEQNYSILINPLKMLQR
jgi:hypothetical protein